MIKEMTQQEKREQYQKINLQISQNRLALALAGLRRLAAECHIHHASEQLEEEGMMYDQMVRYFVLNAPDPRRDQLKDDLKKRLHTLADHLYTNALSSFPGNSFGDNQRMLYRSLNIRHDMLDHLVGQWKNVSEETVTSLETDTEKIFLTLWMSENINNEQLDILRSHLTSNDADPFSGSVLLTGLVLHGLERFSPGIWMLLADVYSAQVSGLWQKALIGLLLMIIRYNHRLNLYPEIGERLLLLDEQPNFIGHLESAAIQLIRTGDTDKVTRKIREEIMPEMMKIAPKIQEKLSLDQFISEEAGEEKNPDWENFFQDSPGVYEKMEELHRMQSEGVDLFAETFSRLKHYPFFKHVFNWFLPFIPEHPAITSKYTEEMISTGLEHFFAVFERSPMMCNSDKYSFAFNMLGMPEQQMRMLLGALSGEMEEMNKVIESDDLLSGSGGETVFHQYTRDLYRFFKAHPGHQENDDPFATKTQLFQCYVMEPLLADNPELIRRLGEYYFQQEHYGYAAEMFSLIENTPQDTPELFQKLAYSYQMMGEIDQALSYYSKAELFDSNVLWNLRKIAFCHQLKNDHKAALKAYRQAEILDPDSLQLKLSIGNLLLRVHKWEEALACYREAATQHAESIKTHRPIAWTLFLLNECEASAHHYAMIMEMDFNHNDMLNYGHVKLALNDRIAALNLYRQSLKHPESSPDAFRNAFENDREHLLRVGIPSETIAFIQDALTLDIQ